MHQRHLAATANALTLSRSLRHRLWDNTSLPTRQLPNVGQVTAGRLRAAGIACLRDLAARDPRWVEQVTSRHYPFGTQLQHALTQLLPPRMELHLQPLRTCFNAMMRSGARRACPGSLGGGRVEVKVRLQRTDKPPASRSTYATLVVGSTQDDVLLLAQPLVIERVASPWVKTVTVQRVPGAEQPCVVVASVIMDRCALDLTNHARHTPLCM